VEEKYKLLSIVLRRLQDAGILSCLILVGSWCQYYYRILFDNTPDIPLIRTTDIDFLVPNPPKTKKNIDIGQLLNSLGFDNDFDYSTGIIKYVHPDLEIQFITPERGRGKDKAYDIKQFQIKVEGIRSLGILQDNSFTMKHGDISLRIPEPEAYVLQKILASRKRTDEDKRKKDLYTALSIGELCLQDHRRKRSMKVIFNTLPKTWQKEILKILKDISPDMYSHLVVRLSVGPS